MKVYGIYDKRHLMYSSGGVYYTRICKSPHIFELSSLKRHLSTLHNSLIRGDKYNLKTRYPNAEIIEYELTEVRRIPIDGDWSKNL